MSRLSTKQRRSAVRRRRHQAEIRMPWAKALRRSPIPISPNRYAAEYEALGWFVGFDWVSPDNALVRWRKANP